MRFMHDVYKEYEEPMPENGVELNDILKQYFKNIDYSTNDNQGTSIVYLDENI